jgi:hypothetical protein
MTNLTPAERTALDLMKKDNFRGISKDNVMQLMSILDKVDPEVAKELIAQIPEAVRGIIEAQKNYTEILSKGIDSAEHGTAACFQTEDDLIKSLQHEAEKEGVSFEEKRFYYEKMEEAAKRKESKDTEHKNMLMSILKYGGQALFMGLIVTASFFLGKTDIALPGKAHS